MNSLLICSHELPLELEKLESLVWCDEDIETFIILLWGSLKENGVRLPWFLVAGSQAMAADSPGTPVAWSS